MADTLCDDRPLAFDDLVAWFDEGAKPASEFKVGAEHEKFVFRTGSHAPVPYEGESGIKALLEGMIYSPEGQPLTGTLLDYALPRASTTPAFTLDTLETLSPLTPLGAKGIGELPTLAAPVAIANAVMDALSHVGVRHIDTPLTPEKIWHALQGKEV